MITPPSPKPSTDAFAPAGVIVKDSKGTLVGQGVVNNYWNERPPVTWPQQIGARPQPKDFYKRTASSDFEISGWGRTLIVTGLGGVGKTQLAADFAQRAQTDVDLLVWVAADSSASLVAVFSEAADRLQLDGADAAATARRFVVWLATTERRWLVVLDDLQDPKDIGDCWPPERPNGCTVVTTRRRDTALLSLGSHVEVGVFTADEAEAFLQDKLGPSSSAALLASDLGYLPLAMAHAVAYMQDLELTYDEYRSRLADRTRRLEELFSDFSTGSSHARVVASTWQVSIDAANESRPSGIARPVLELASQLDANGIPTQVFTTGPAQQWISGRIGAAAGQTLRPTDCNDALQVLGRFNLVVNEKTASLARVHALVQRAVRESLQADERRVALTAADALLTAWPEIEKDRGQADLLRTNAFALYDHCPDALWNGEDNHPVLNRANRSFGDGALIEHAIRHARDMCAESERRLGRRHRCTFRWRRDLAGWQGDAGSGKEAVETLKSVVVDAESLLGPRDPVVLEARSSLAYQRGQAGDPAAAVAGLLAVADDMARVFGPLDRSTLSAGNEAGYWIGKGGNAAQAVDFLKPVLADAKTVLAADDRMMFDIRHNLGYWIGEAGKPAESVTVLQAVLDDAEKALGPHHRDVSGYRSNLAYMRGRAGDIKGAIAALEAVLAERIDMFGLSHRNTLASWSSYLQFRIQLGEHGDDVLDEATQLAGIYTDVHGATHHETLNAREILGSLRGTRGDVTGAVADLANVLADREKMFPGDTLGIEKTRTELDRWRALEP
ncbi:NB-ARC domain-containing protein [Aldersonia sp. NBC_00410]|uniref:tetratricopeptide repeat protein n=1 Tax=Aldersonia sp. NBC_00410 TaxID=2975954 RepID=UPI00225257B9|nr:tetratricopeptide repeat protein [Aldersonia sp. NBC_00410]MCX5042468.1 NB-ARC domain-containing protein [Aldersonia sp. NBC_00410]